MQLSASTRAPAGSVASLTWIHVWNGALIHAAKDAAKTAIVRIRDAQDNGPNPHCATGAITYLNPPHYGTHAPLAGAAKQLPQIMAWRARFLNRRQCGWLIREYEYNPSLPSNLYRLPRLATKIPYAYPAVFAG